MKQLLLLGLLLALTQPARSQAQAPVDAGLSTFFNSPNRVLPHLYLAAIRHSAEVERLNIGYDIAQADVKLARKRILNLLALTSSYNYGTLPYFATAETTSPIYQINPFNLGARAQYSAGVSLVAPLDVLASRRTSIRRQELLADQVVAQRHMFEETIRQQVITYYQSLALARTLMMRSQESMQSARLSKQIADQRFQQGELSLEEQLMSSDFYNKATVAYEEACNRYQTAELLLENLIGESITSAELTK